MSSVFALPSPGSPPYVVGIPARNEVDRLPACLAGFAAQRGAPRFSVVVLLNNCTDGSAGLLDRMAPALPFPLVALSRWLPPEGANAGVARSLVMRYAAELAGPDGVLMTTDADGVVAPGWIAGTAKALAAGADAVCGRAVIDPVEALTIPQGLHDADAHECAYSELLDRIASLVDPDPADPWPRHAEASGASIAVTRRAYDLVGGMAPIPAGEDRAFVAALQQRDLRVRHAPDVFVTVSGRIEGRAKGGMADTIRRRMTAPDLFLDDRLEAAEPWLLRLLLRRLARDAHRAEARRPALAKALRLPEAIVGACLAGEYFGQAWAALAAASPRLAARRVPVAALPRETALATGILARLLQSSSVEPAASSKVSSSAG